MFISNYFADFFLLSKYEPIDKFLVHVHGVCSPVQSFYHSSHNPAGYYGNYSDLSLIFLRSRTIITEQGAL